MLGDAFVFAGFAAIGVAGALWLFAARRNPGAPQREASGSLKPTGAFRARIDALRKENPAPAQIVGELQSGFASLPLEGSDALKAAALVGDLVPALLKGEELAGTNRELANTLIASATDVLDGVESEDSNRSYIALTHYYNAIRAEKERQARLPDGSAS